MTLPPTGIFLEGSYRSIGNIFDGTQKYMPPASKRATYVTKYASIVTCNYLIYRYLWK